MQPSNYRPISNLSTISKISERVVLKRLSSHVSVLRNFNLFQSAYCFHHSTETALLYITDSLRNICATRSAAVLVSRYFSSFWHHYSSNFHLHAIRQARKFLPFDTAVALISSLVLSRIDYCNSLFCRLPNCLISKLQSLQNHAAKTVLQADYYSSSRTCLDRLHWLPVALRAQFKLLWLTANTLYFNQPAYLYDRLSIRQTPEFLRSSNSGLWLHQPVSSNSFLYRPSLMELSST